MGVIFDILGSFVVRAAIVAILLNLMLMLHGTLYRTTQQVYLNQVIISPSQTISNDLALAGYNSSTNFLKADLSEMIFYADLDNNGTSETVRYYVSNNILYRTINGGTPFELARSVTKFEISYYNILGSQLSYTYVPPRTTVKSVFVQITLASTNKITTINSGKMDTTTQTVSWSKHIFPQNL